LDRVLRGDDEERRRKAERLVPDRHLALLHRLEERALHLRRRAVDLVGEKEVREDRAFPNAELVRALVEELAPEDVRGQEVDRELDAREVEVDRLRERGDEEGLREARDALEHEVAAGEERDQQALDDGLLADDDGPDTVADGADEGLRVLESLAGGACGRRGG